MSSVAPGPLRALPPEVDDDEDAGPLRPTMPMRLSSMLPPEPSSSLWSRRRTALVATACALMTSLAVLLVSKVARQDVQNVIRAAPLALLFPEKNNALKALLPGEASGRADANLDRKGRSPIAGGLMFIPPGFESEDGAYDLVVHFHGNNDVIEESFGIAKVDAVVVSLNLGNGSGPYEDRFENPQSIVDIVARVQGTMVHRGLRDAHRRRLALSAWSAGYGAIERALEHSSTFADVDAVLLEDGIHAGYVKGTTTLETARIAMFERFGKEAMAGRKLLSIAHSDVRPIDYAGTHETTDALLGDLGVRRGDPGPSPIMPVLEIDRRGRCRRKACTPS